MARRKKKTLSKLKEYKFSNINFRLLLYVVCLTVIGILAIGSATSGGTEKTDFRICNGNYYFNNFKFSKL